MNAKLLSDVAIANEGDIVTVRKVVRELATQLGFSLTDVTRIVTAASELARNVFLYGGGGTVQCQELNSDNKLGIELLFADRGPGIDDVEKAMEEGYTTSGGLGLGLPGAKRLMDELKIDSKPAGGTRVTVRKWRTA